MFFSDLKTTKNRMSFQRNIYDYNYIFYLFTDLETNTKKLR